jgi:hypothetical protein
VSRAWKNEIQIRHVPERLHDQAVAGLTEGAEHILKVSNDHVPIEEGTLERSGTATVDGPNLRAAIAYDTAYAVRQHEDLDAQHDAGRTAKYLENAMNSQRLIVRKLIAAKMRE